MYHVIMLNILRPIILFSQRKAVGTANEITISAAEFRCATKGYAQDPIFSSRLYIARLRFYSQAKIEMLKRRLPAASVSHHPSHAMRSLGSAGELRCAAEGFV